jgi:hypothetical protein
MFKAGDITNVHIQTVIDSINDSFEDFIKLSVTGKPAPNPVKRHNIKK